MVMEMDASCALTAMRGVKQLRNMLAGGATTIFDMLAMKNFQGALALEPTVRDLARRRWGSRIAAHYSSVSLAVLPCQAFEFGGILGAVRGIRGCGDAQAIVWLLKHLPDEASKPKAMG